MSTLRFGAVTFVVTVTIIGLLVLAKNSFDPPTADAAGGNRDGVSTVPTTLPPPTLPPTTTVPPTTASTATVSTATVPTTTVLPTTAPTTAAPTTTLPAPTGTFTPSTRREALFGASPFMQFSVAVEDGLGVDPDELADFVDETLADDRSWIGDGRRGFQRVEDGGLFTLIVAHPETVDRLCLPLQTNGVYSCARNGWVAINYERWQGATDFWPASLEDYRRYVVNHEIGHYLGQPHVPCPSSGELAPIMQQQTIGLDGCEANGWPNPGR